MIANNLTANSFDFINFGLGDNFVSEDSLLSYKNNTKIKKVLVKNLIIRGDVANNTLSGNSGNDLLKGGLGNDSLDGKNGNDTLFGNSGNDLLKGGAGNDSLDGGAGNDALYGDAGVDTLIGGSGSDILHDYDRENDILVGGLGSDVFAFSGSTGSKTTIKDFTFEEGDQLRIANGSSSGTYYCFERGGDLNILSESREIIATLENVNYSEVSNLNFVDLILI